MSRIEISTITASYEDGWDSQELTAKPEVVLHFGNHEIGRWPAQFAWTEHDEDKQAYADEFAAEKLRALLAAEQSEASDAQ